MKTKTVLGLLALVTIVPATIALAQAVSYKLSINGRSYSSSAIVVRGETYVPLKALQVSGVRSSLAGGVLTLTLPGAQSGGTGNQQVAGGANQVAALEGCINEWLFNGIWRVRVTDPQVMTGDRNGMSFRFEFRNGTKKAGFAPSGTGFRGIQMALDDGTTVGAANVNEVSDPPYIQGGSHAQTIEFFWEDTARTPTKLIVLFDPNDDYYKLGTLKFSVPDPSLRFKTNCQK
jgi:hypothetical protein